MIEQVIFNLLENAVLHADGMTELILKFLYWASRLSLKSVTTDCGIEKNVSAVYLTAATIYLRIKLLTLTAKNTIPV